jgi:translation elongation factor P/translation initiation factor 5A
MVIFSSGEVTINGNLTVNTLKDSSGNSMVRKVGNVVHIGTNSFTIEDASTSASGKDEIASSINELQIGTSASHNTTVLGTLSVQTPTSNSHATTKIYVDNLVNTNMNSVQKNLGLINTNIDNISNLETGMAQSMAMSALSSPGFGRSNFSIATGNYNGTNAIAYGLSHHDNSNNVMYRLIGSQSGSVSSSAASIGWGF